MCHGLSKIKAQSPKAIFVCCDLSSVFRFLYSSPLLTKWTNFKNKNDYWVTYFSLIFVGTYFHKFDSRILGGFVFPISEEMIFSCEAVIWRRAQNLKICRLAKMNMAKVRYVPWKLVERLKSFRKKNSPKNFRLGFRKLIGHLGKYIYIYIYFFYDKKIYVNILIKVFFSTL